MTSRLTTRLEGPVTVHLYTHVPVHCTPVHLYTVPCTGYLWPDSTGYPRRAGVATVYPSVSKQEQHLHRRARRPEGWWRVIGKDGRHIASHRRVGTVGAQVQWAPLRCAVRGHVVRGGDHGRCCDREQCGQSPAKKGGSRPPAANHGPADYQAVSAGPYMGIGAAS
eukprot:9481143-Pyramimonas_sp.AAC.2